MDWAFLLCKMFQVPNQIWYFPNLMSLNLQYIPISVLRALRAASEGNVPEKLDI